MNLVRLGKYENSKQYICDRKLNQIHYDWVLISLYEVYQMGYRVLNTV